jgi:hypothetical protein
MADAGSLTGAALVNEKWFADHCGRARIERDTDP